MGRTYERKVESNEDVRRLYKDVLNMPDVEFYRGYTGINPGQGALVEFEVGKDWYRHLKSGEWGINPSYTPEITLPFDEMFNGSEQPSEVSA